MMREYYSMEDVILLTNVFENQHPDILAFKFNDSAIPIWPFIKIRLQFLLSSSEDKKKSSVIRAIREPYNGELNRAEKRNPYESGHYDLVFALYQNALWEKDDSGIVCEKRYFSYINFLPDNTTTLVDFVSKVKWDGMCSYPNWKVNNIIRENAEKSFDCISRTNTPKEFALFLKKNYPISIPEEVLRETLFFILDFQMRWRSYVREYDKCLDRINPKLVFINLAGSFYLSNTALLYACKKRNIPTAEIQHGVYSPLMRSVNFGRSIIEEPEMKQVLPDYLLLWGDYRSDLAITSAEKIVVGTSRFDDVSRAVHNNNILFAVEYNHPVYIRILEQLFSADDNQLVIYFRLHPETVNDSTAVERYNRFLKYENFNFANSESLNYYLNICDSVVVDGSTVEVEALSVGRHVFAIDDDLYKNIGVNNEEYVKKFKTGDEFLDLWKNRKDIPGYEKLFFVTDWKDRFGDFLKSNGVEI